MLRCGHSVVLEHPDGDGFYATLLFGAMALAERRFPVLREPLAANAN